MGLMDDFNGNSPLDNSSADSGSGWGDFFLTVGKESLGQLANAGTGQLMSQWGIVDDDDTDPIAQAAGQTTNTRAYSGEQGAQIPGTIMVLGHPVDKRLLYGSLGVLGFALALKLTS